jgi:hypothetical protein
MVVRRLTAVALATAAIGVAAIAPAAAATSPRSAADSAPTQDCAKLSSQLQADLTGVLQGLTALPPDPSAATKVIGVVLADVSKLQDGGCLPKLPPGPGANPACVSDLSTLLSDTFATLADLAKVPPDLTGAITDVKGAVTALSALVADKCLPAPVSTPPLPVPAPPLPVGA